MVEGQNENGRTSTVEKYEGGDVHIFEDTDELADGDGSTELTNKSADSEATDAADWTITHDNTAGTTTLENAAEIRFTDVNDAIYSMAAIVNETDDSEFIISPFDESEDMDAGDELFFPAGDLEFTVGGE